MKGSKKPERKPAKKPAMKPFTLDKKAEGKETKMSRPSVVRAFFVELEFDGEGPTPDQLNDYLEVLKRQP